MSDNLKAEIERQVRGYLDALKRRGSIYSEVTVLDDGTVLIGPPPHITIRAPLSEKSRKEITKLFY